MKLEHLKQKTSLYAPMFMTIFCTNQWLDNFFGSGRISNTRSNHSLFPFIWYSKHSTWRGLTHRLSSYSISNQSASWIIPASYFGPISWRNQLRILFWTNQMAESTQDLILDQSAGWIISASCFDQSAGWIISASCFGPISWMNHFSLLFWTNQLAELS